MTKDLKITLENLAIVARELPILAESMPSIRRDFDMSDFGVYCRKSVSDVKNHVCNTAGCLLGNSALVLKTKVTDFRVFYRGDEIEFDYDKFGRRVFPYLEEYGNEWEFLFGNEWVDFQPNFEQAIERVNYFIAKQGNIGDWRYQTESFIFRPPVTVNSFLDVEVSELSEHLLSLLKHTPTYRDLSSLQEHIFSLDDLDNADMFNDALLTEYKKIAESCEANSCSYFRLVNNK